MESPNRGGIIFCWGEILASALLVCNILMVSCYRGKRDVCSNISRGSVLFHFVGSRIDIRLILLGRCPVNIDTTQASV